jgi:DNA repair ATPase RecN
MNILDKIEAEQRKQDVYDRAAQVASQAAYLQFQTSMLAKGQGTITDNERRLFSATTIGVRDSVSTMNKKADMIIERANFAQNIASRLNQNKMSLDQFRETPEYKKMADAYENKLRNIWNPTRAQSQTTTAPLTPEQLKAARDRVNGVLP